MGVTTELTRRVAASGPLCAGVDPSASLLEEWGLPDDASGLREFCGRCLEGFAGVVPVVKPQVAFFERHGSAGIAVLESFLAGAREAGLLVIADAKRADIANTVEAYADAWLGPTSPLRADAVTAVPYLGLASLEPLVDAAARSGSAVIVVIRSSNPEGRVIQEARLATEGEAQGESPSVEDALLAQIATRNAAFRAEHPDWSLGPIGAVIGATLEPSGFPLGISVGPSSLRESERRGRAPGSCAGCSADARPARSCRTSRARSSPRARIPALSGGRPRRLWRRRPRRSAEVPSGTFDDPLPACRRAVSNRSPGR